MPLGKIRRAHIRRHELELQRKGLAAATRSVVRAVLSRAFADAVEDDLISTNPCDGLRRSAERPTPKRFTVWTADELRSLLDAADDDRLEALWRVAVATGARRGELLGLTWLGFSAQEGTLTISQQVVPTRGGPTIAEVKTKGSHRTIRLDADTVEALERHRERQLAERDAALDAYTDDDLIFADELGRPINPQRLTEAFGELRGPRRDQSGQAPRRPPLVRHASPHPRRARAHRGGEARAQLAPSSRSTPTRTCCRPGRAGRGRDGRGAPLAGRLQHGRKPA